MTPRRWLARRHSPWLTAAVERETVQATRAMLVAAVGGGFLPLEAQAITLAAGVRGDDPRRELLEPLLDVRAGRGREVEGAVVRGRRLVGLHEQAAAARKGAPRHLSRRIAVAKLAQSRPFLVAGAMHGRRIAAGRGLRRRLVPPARRRPGQQSQRRMQPGPGTKQPERKRRRQLDACDT